MASRDFRSQVSSFKPLTKILLVAGSFAVVTVLVLLGLVAGLSNPTSPLANGFSSLLAVNSVQVWWYITRAAGLMAYLLIWLSTVWGFAVGTKIFDPLLERMFTYDFHEYLSLLGLGFLFTHIVALLADRYQPFNALQILIPFIAPYRPFWVGIGILAAYLSILVTVTFYIRTLVSRQTFRKIHILSVLAYLGATLHGLYAGTDSPLTVVQLMYWGTFLSAVFLCGYWLVTLFMQKQEEKEQARQLARQRRRGGGGKAAVRTARR